MKNTIRTILVDDELDSIEVLLDLISESNTGLEVVGTAQTAQEAIRLIRSVEPQLVLLDIHMPGGSGFDVLKEVRSYHFHTLFISAYDGYALEAIKFHAMGYLLKPVGVDEFCEVVNQVKERLHEEMVVHYQALLQNMRNDEKKIAIPTGGGHVYFEAKEIVRIEAAKNYSNVYTTLESKPILVSKNLKQFENLLSKFGFLRVHHTHVINPKHIREYIRQDGGSVLLSDGASIFIGQSYKNQVLDYLQATSEKL